MIIKLHQIKLIIRNRLKPHLKHYPHGAKIVLIIFDGENLDLAFVEAFQIYLYDRPLVYQFQGGP